MPRPKTYWREPDFLERSSARRIAFVGIGDDLIDAELNEGEFNERAPGLCSHSASGRRLRDLEVEDRRDGRQIALVGVANDDWRRAWRRACRATTDLVVTQ